MTSEVGSRRIGSCRGSWGSIASVGGGAGSIGEMEGHVRGARRRGRLHERPYSDAAPRARAAPALGLAAAAVDRRRVDETSVSVRTSGPVRARWARLCNACDTRRTPPASISRQRATSGPRLAPASETSLPPLRPAILASCHPHAVPSCGQETMSALQTNQRSLLRCLADAALAVGLRHRMLGLAWLASSQRSGPPRPTLTVGVDRHL